MSFSSTALGEPAPQESKTAHDAQTWTGHFSFALGVKYLGRNCCTQHAMGVGLLDLDVRKRRWPVSFVAQWEAAADGISRDTIYEFSPGVRRVWGDRRLQPFVGTGISILRVHAEEGTAAQTSWGVGPGVDAGTFWRLWKRWHVGARFQYSYVHVPFTPVPSPGGTYLGSGLNAGGAQATILLGWRW